MSSPVEKYVKHLEQQCGPEPSTIVVLKWEKRKEALDKILAKLENKRTIGGMLVKATYKGVKVSVYMSGKLLLEGTEEKEARSLLSELLG